MSATDGLDSGRDPSGRKSSTPDENSLLQIAGASAGYVAGAQILSDVTLSVSAAESVALIGPNGAGKSTVLKMLMGLVRQWSGSTTFRGMDITNWEPSRLVDHGIGFVPQNDNVFLPMTVDENLDVGGLRRRSGVTQRKEELYDLFPALAEKRRDRAGTLSGGQRQMLAMARALMLQPGLLLLDEPTAGLSPKLTELVFATISLIQEQEVAVLLVEQQARRALEICDRAYVLVGGTPVIDGRGRDLLGNVDFGAMYLGT